MADLIVARAFSHPHEAHLACSALRAAGLNATLADSNIVAANWLYSNLVGGVKVLVRDEDLAVAREILDTVAIVDRTGEEGHRTNNGAEQAPVCPRCGSTSIVTVRRGKRLAVLTWLVMNFPFFPVWRKARCQHCGFESVHHRCPA